MGAYLLLRWLQTRGGVIFCLVLLIWTATASLCHLGSDRSVDPQQEKSATAIRSGDRHASVLTQQHEKRDKLDPN
jgi:hypothetical protein